MCKKKMFLVCVILVLLSFSGFAMAHPPSEVRVDYDSVSEILVVEAFHSVGDPVNHFIESILVSVDNEPYYELVSKRQTDSSAAEALFYLPDLSPGTRVEVEVKCSRFGSRKAVLIVDQE